MAGADIGVDYPLDATPHTVERSLDAVQILYAVQGVPMMPTRTGYGPRRTTGALFVAGALVFAGAATVLSSTFDWPDILREPADVGDKHIRAEQGDANDEDGDVGADDGRASERARVEQRLARRLFAHDEEQEQEG